MRSLGEPFNHVLSNADRQDPNLFSTNYNPRMTSFGLHIVYAGSIVYDRVSGLSLIIPTLRENLSYPAAYTYD